MLEHITDVLQKLDVKENGKTLAANAGYFRKYLAIKNIEQKGSELFICTKKKHMLRKTLNEKRLSDSRIPALISNREHIDTFVNSTCL